MVSKTLKTHSCDMLGKAAAISRRMIPDLSLKNLLLYIEWPSISKMLSVRSRPLTNPRCWVWTVSAQTLLRVKLMAAAMYFADASYRLIGLVSFALRAIPAASCG